jgi:hypothetical protein
MKTLALSIIPQTILCFKNQGNEKPHSAFRPNGVLPQFRLLGNKLAAVTKTTKL